MLWGLNSVTAQPTSGAAVSWLRGQIHSGLLLPGEKLPSERKLAEDIGISRVTLREALKALEAAQYVAIRRGVQGGAFVTEGVALQVLAARHLARDPGAALRLQECRAMVEPGAARLAATRRDVPDLKHLDHAFAMVRTAAGPAEVRQAETMFRLALAEATHNPYLVRMVRESLFEALLPYPRAVPDARDAPLFARLLEALHDRDEVQAETGMRQIVARDWADLRVALRG